MPEGCCAVVNWAGETDQSTTLEDDPVCRQGIYGDNHVKRKSIERAVIQGLFGRAAIARLCEDEGKDRNITPKAASKPPESRAAPPQRFLLSPQDLPHYLDLKLLK